MEDKITQLTQKVDLIMEALAKQSLNLEDTLKHTIATEIQKIQTTETLSTAIKENTKEKEPAPERRTEANTESENQQEEEEKNDQHTREEVVRKNNRRRRPTQVIGTKEDSENLLEAGIRKAWLYLGKLKEGTRENSVIQFLKRNKINGDVTCEQFPTKGRFKSFKVGIEMQHLETVQKAEFWPKGIAVRRFRISPVTRYAPEGVTLE